MNSITKSTPIIPPPSAYISTYGQSKAARNVLVPLVQGGGEQRRNTTMFRGLSGYITNPPSSPSPLQALKQKSGSKHKIVDVDAVPSPPKRVYKKKKPAAKSVAPKKSTKAKNKKSTSKYPILQ